MKKYNSLIPLFTIQFAVISTGIFFSLKTSFDNYSFWPTGIYTSIFLAFLFVHSISDRKAYLKDDNFFIVKGLFNRYEFKLEKINKIVHFGDIDNPNGISISLLNSKNSFFIPGDTLGIKSIFKDLSKYATSIEYKELKLKRPPSKEKIRIALVIFGFIFSISFSFYLARQGLR